MFSEIIVNIKDILYSKIRFMYIARIKPPNTVQDTYFSPDKTEDLKDDCYDYRAFLPAYTRTYSFLGDLLFGNTHIDIA